MMIINQRNCWASGNHSEGLRGFPRCTDHKATMPRCECRQRLSATHGKLCGAVDHLLVTWLLIFTGEFFVIMIQGVLNSGTPKWMVYNGKSYKWMIWGYPQWIENPHIPATYKPLDQPVDLFGVFHGSIVFLFLEKPEVQSCWIRQKDFKHYADLLTTVEPNHVEILIHLPFISFIRICLESPRLLHQPYSTKRSATAYVHNSFRMYIPNIPDISKAQLLTHPIF